MANSVIFLKGTAAQYASATKNANTFYYTTDDAQLYLGEIKLSNAAEIAAVVADLDTLEALVEKINGDASIVGSFRKEVADAVALINTDLGNVDDLSTENKTVVGAINEVLAAVGTGGTAAVVTMTESSSDEYAKIYTLKQGTTNIGTINIPKDMVVESGIVETKTEAGAWGEAGTYIVLTLANAASDKLYVNVGTLVDIYKAQANAAQVQLAIDSSTREISATIVAGSITATELANNAIVTAKIADGNVTKDKLSTAVQASLGLADSALQAADITTGSANGTIAVEGTDVAVAGLKSAAYTDATAYDAAGSAAAVLGTAADTKDSDTVYGVKAYAKDLDTEMDKRVDALETAIGEGGSVDSQINTKIAELDADITSAAVEAGKGIQVQVVEVDGKITNVNVTGNYDNKYDAKGAAEAIIGNADSAEEDDLTIEGTRLYAAAVAQRTVDAALTWGNIGALEG